MRPPLLPCPSCHRHVRAREACPFCGAESAPERARRPAPRAGLSRTALLAFGAALATSPASCGGDVVKEGTGSEAAGSGGASATATGTGGATSTGSGGQGGAGAGSGTGAGGDAGAGGAGGEAGQGGEAGEGGGFAPPYGTPPPEEE